MLRLSSGVILDTIAGCLLCLLHQPASKLSSQFQRPTSQSTKTRIGCLTSKAAQSALLRHPTKWSRRSTKESLIVTSLSQVRPFCIWINASFVTMNAYFWRWMHLL